MSHGKKRILYGIAALLLAAAAAAGIFAYSRPDGNSPYQALPPRANVQSLPAVRADSGYTLALEPLNLNLTVTGADGREYHSGKRASEDDGLNKTWAAKLTDGFVIGYRNTANNSVTERAITELSSDITVSEISGGYSARVVLRDVRIEFTAKIYLDGSTLSVEIPYTSIAEKDAKFRLMYIIPYMFMDSSFGLSDGAILVPDGSGALIDLSRKTSAKQKYTARVYGDDEGIKGSKTKGSNINTVQMPVYGIYYEGEGGVLAVAESGAEYAEFTAAVKDILTQYNFCYTRFIYREDYTKYFESAGSEGKSYIDYQADKNVFDLKMRYILLDKTKGDLSSAAGAYREYLEAAGVLSGKDKAADKGLKIKFLVAENKPSMFGSTTVEMTDIDFIREKLPELKGVSNNLGISLMGYKTGGLTGSYPKHFPLYGSDSRYKKLAEDCGADVQLSYVTDHVAAYENGGGYSRSDNAMSISDQFIRSADGRRMLTLKKTADIFLDDAQRIQKTKGAAADVESMGSMLFTSFKNQSFSRTEQMKKYSELLSKTALKKNLTYPSQYLWKNADSYLSAPLSGSGFIIADQSVPFLQMVLSGNLEMYSSALNLNFMGEVEILKLIDYNVSPSFLLTQKDSIELIGSQSDYIFTSMYDTWIGDVKRIYTRVNEVLAPVSGCKFVQRQRLADGVYCNTFDNGKKVYINYTASEYTAGSVSVPAAGAAVV